ncbi:hypothetical protein VTK26DRAFT_5543 [Humicola hyalothermophila]
MASRRECVVCFEFKDPSKFPDTPLTGHCESGNLPMTCSACLSEFLRVQINTGFSVDISCPDCAGLLSYETVRRYADAESRERYENMCVRHALQQDEDFIWCAADCGSGQVHDGGGGQPIVKCVSCGSKTCFLHKVPWHAGMTCEEWDMLAEPTPTEEQVSETSILQRAQELRASKEIIDRTTKPCPNCKWNIEKNGGCDHMTCIHCLHQFCWECMADFCVIIRTDNDAHREDCPYHTKNLD